MCDSLCALPARTVDGVARFAKNSDRPPAEAQELEWHPPRRDDGPVRATYVEIEPHRRETLGVLGSRPHWMWGFEHGVNVAGLAVGNEAIWTNENPAHHPEALVGMDLVRLALERAESAEAGVEVIVSAIERHGQGGSGHEGGTRPYWSSFLLVDPHGAWVVDTSGRDVAVEAVDGSRAISNRPSIATFDDQHGLHHEVIDARVDARWEAGRELLTREPAVGTGQLQDHLRSHVGGDGGWTVCMHAGDEATTAGIVAELPSDQPPVAHVVLGQPCSSLFVPVVVGEALGPVPRWSELAALADRAARDPDLVVELRALEASLAAELRIDPAWNAEAWSRVRDLLSRHR